jgi:hypothetical protein
MTQQASLDVAGLKRFVEQRVVDQIDLADGEVVGGAPIRVYSPERFGEYG